MNLQLQSNLTLAMSCEGKSKQESLPMTNPSQNKREITTDTHVDKVDMLSASVSRQKMKASGRIHAIKGEFPPGLLNSRWLGGNSSGGYKNSCAGRWIRQCSNEFSCSHAEFIRKHGEFMPSKVNSLLACWIHDGWAGIHAMEDEFIGIGMNSLEAMPNSCHRGWISPWPVEFMMAGWQFILRMIIIRVLEDEFVGVAMNSLAAVLNSSESMTNSCNDRWIPPLLDEFVVILHEFLLWMREFTLYDWFTATRSGLIWKWLRIHVIGMDSFLSAVNSQTVLVNSHLYLTNSRFERWIPSGFMNPHKLSENSSQGWWKFTCCKMNSLVWQWILLQYPEFTWKHDEFMQQKMNSFSSIWTCNEPMWIHLDRTGNSHSKSVNSLDLDEFMTAGMNLPKATENSNDGEWILALLPWIHAVRNEFLPIFLYS